jgi:acetoin utilization protein AcuB
MERRLLFLATMRVQEIMSTPVFSVSPELDAEGAWQKMKAGRVHHLAVLEGQRLVGVLSERDLGGERGQTLRKNRVVVELMTPHAVVARPTTTVKEAANFMRGHSIGCLPVLEGGKLVGMVTTTDVLELIGRGAERPAPKGQRWTLKDRGPRVGPGTRSATKAATTATARGRR